MESLIGANLARHLERHRERMGNTVTFNGIAYRVSTMAASRFAAGTSQLPTKQMGPFFANLDPRVFVFTPSDFAPTTDVNPPWEGDTLGWGIYTYRVTALHIDALADDPTRLRVFAYRLRSTGGAPGAVSPITLDATAIVYRNVPVKDATSAQKPKWGPAHTYPCALLAQGAPTEKLVNGTLRAVSTWTIAFPLGSDVVSADRLKIAGVWHEVTDTNAGISGATYLSVNAIRMNLPDLGES